MKIKKILSILLAVLMISSCFTSAISVFAANTTESVKSLIDSFSGDMTLAEPTEEDLANYNKMVNAFNTLSQEEINNFDVFSFDKLLLAVYDREMALWKKENNSTSTANAYKAVHKRAEGIITMPSYVAEAAALYVEANAIKTQQAADAFIETLTKASTSAAILAGGYYSSYSAFRYSISEQYGAELIDNAADKISSLTQAGDVANKCSSPKSVSKPSASKYEGGENDPDYITAYKAYLKYKEDQADYNVARYAFEGEKHYFAALKKLTDAAPYFSFIYEIAVASVEAKRNFNTNGGTEKVADVVAIYNNLTEAQTNWFKATDGYVFSEKVVSSESALGIEYGYNNLKISDLVEFCKSMEFYYTIKNFEDLVSSISAPYTNTDIANAKQTYNAIPESILGSVNADSIAKYKEILAAIGPDDASDAEPDLGIYSSTDVSFNYFSEKNAEMLADVTIELVLKAAGVSDVKELINTKVLTNSTVVTLAGFVYPLLSEKTDDLINVTPSSLAKELNEEKFAGAVEALTTAGEDWSAVVVKNGDFGFEDGDAEGFLDATAAILRGASLLHVALTLENKIDTSKGTYTYGAYEEFIEVFELLDLKAVMSSDEYTTYVNSAEIKNDAKFRAILAPIVYLLVDFGNDPVNMLYDLLPKVAYAIDSGVVNNRINNILSQFAVITIDPVDLTTSGVYKIINDNLLTPNNIALSEEEFGTLIKDLAGCGTAVSKNSVQRGQNYRMGIESDKAKTIVVLMSWILDIAGNNREFVNSLLDMILGDNAFLKFALKILINVSTTFIPRAVIFNLASIFIYIAKFFAGVSKIL